jgi:hypothetical protein
MILPRKIYRREAEAALACEQYAAATIVIRQRVPKVRLEYRRQP